MVRRHPSGHRTLLYAQVMAAKAVEIGYDILAEANRRRPPVLIPVTMIDENNVSCVSKAGPWK